MGQGLANSIINRAATVNRCHRMRKGVGLSEATLV